MAKQKRGRNQNQKQTKNRNQNRKQASNARPVAKAPDATSNNGGWSVAFAIGLVLLVLAAIGSGALSGQSLFGANLPGCGPGSDCAKAANSVWGKIGGIKWLTTANIGLAYFIGMAVAWIASRGQLGPALRGLVRVTALVSIGLPIVMIVNGYVCKYCLLVHFANLTFIAVVEVAGREPVQRSPLVSFGSVAVIAGLVLTGAQFRHERGLVQQAEDDLAQSTQAIIEQPRDDTPPPPDAEPFTGRYLQGPEEAPVRIVIISDYQCPDCKRIETEVRGILAKRPDVSFSAKHFPFCHDCNPSVRNMKNLHPNACWAARAAETAGILGGEEGFWRMHHWLFDRGGAFTDQELSQAIPELGFDYRQFASMMQSQQTLTPVEQDIDEASALGIRQTPMIFINGVELLGWHSTNAIVRAVDKVAATNPPPLTAAADRPPFALEKHINDWKSQPRVQIPADASEWRMGTPGVPGRVTIWGDYQEPFTKQLDARVRAVAGRRSDVTYTFRHYPIDQACNTTASRTIHPQACLAHKAAEAAGILGGNDAYWAMHAWLFDNQPNLTLAKLRGAAPSLGLDPGALVRTMESPEVQAEIDAEAVASKRLFLRGVPLMFVNEKRVPFWALKDQPLPERIIEEAAAGRTEK